ncbi:hypothetical protein B0H17DRAFT_700158 [Mycena rosella]|uniref:Uncharacterized protein n=1 Tax=Mycena rosella TaxID=1033263 RepID=A0AAD7GBW3_MYCRO|nr:hypothetical protein B0H17DRAFT_700158 [Mycena rosella]
MQRTLPPAAAPARKIAGARRVARAVSAPRAPRAVLAMEVEVENVSASASASASTTEGRLGSTPEGEVFQSITAIPGLESTSFEVRRHLPSPPPPLLSQMSQFSRHIPFCLSPHFLIAVFPASTCPLSASPAYVRTDTVQELRLETYLQSLVATGTARPQPAFAPALVIPPAFSAPFCDWDRDAARGDVEMVRSPSFHLFSSCVLLPRPPSSPSPSSRPLLFLSPSRHVAICPI